MSAPSAQELSQRGERYLELSGKLRNLAILKFVLSMTLVCIILGMVYSIYSAVCEMYTAEKFQPHLVKHGENLKPVLTNAVQQVLSEAKPAYETAFQQEFQKMRPELEERAMEEWHTLNEHAGTRLNTSLNLALNNVAQHQEERLFPQFPRLANSRQKQIMVDKWHASFVKVNEDILFEAHNRYMGELEKIGKTLGRFRTAHFDQANVNDLGLYYAHLWLMAIDQHLMLGALKDKKVAPTDVPGTEPEAVAGKHIPASKPAVPVIKPVNASPVGATNSPNDPKKVGGAPNATR